MRYYAIRIVDPATDEILIPNLDGVPGFGRVPYDPQRWTYTSLNKGASVTTVGGHNPGAQRIELSIATGPLDLPQVNSFVRIWGIGINEISQSADLNGMDVAIYGGMSKGLPLANPAQSGLLTSGMVFQAFANWINTDQTLDLYLSPTSSPSSAETTGRPSTYQTVPAVTTNKDPANLTFQWKSGQKLLDALVPSLARAYPKYTVKGQVSPNLVWVGSTSTGYFNNPAQLAKFIRQCTLSLISGYAPDLKNYLGVQITLQGSTFVISDGTQPTTPKQLEFVDLVGQVTWRAPYQIQVTCVLRADISVGDYIKLPLTPGTTEQGSASQFFNPQPNNLYATAKSGSIFSGTFQVVGQQHTGDSTGVDGQAWITVLDCIQTPPTTKAPIEDLPMLYEPNRSYHFYLPS
jgi:hypothetical protein